MVSVTVEGTEQYLNEFSNSWEIHRNEEARERAKEKKLKYKKNKIRRKLITTD